jgi:HAE1 family hydrophobic/amphiphilic exporter-1
MKFSALAVRRPVTTAMCFLAILVLGLVSFSRLAVDQLPNVTRPSITVSTDYEGAAPEIVERLITEPLEKTLATINNVKAIRSFSGEGNARVTLDFNWGTNIDLVALDVHEKVSNIIRSLPDDADPPRVSKFDPASWAIMTLNLAASGPMSLIDLWDYADNTLRYQLQQIPGVAAVEIWGGDQRQIQVLVDRSRLEATGITLERVVSAIQAENSTKVGGRLTRGQTEYVVRPLGEFHALEDLADVVLRADGQTPVYLKHVAEIRDSVKERLSETRVNRVPGLVLAVRKQSGTNTVQISDAIQAKLPLLQQQLPRGMRLQMLFDRAVFIRRSIAQVEQSAMFGGLIAVIVLVGFLRSMRPTVIIALSMPVAVMATFILLYQADISLNWMSLGGLALGIGMLVDNSVVVLENIFRHRQQGAAPQRAAIVGTQEVGLAIVASTLTTLCVFFPLIFMHGMMGIVFQELALTVTFSLVASLLVALTLVPMLSAKWLSQNTLDGPNNLRWQHFHAVWRRALVALDSGYQRALSAALRYRGLVLCGCLLFLGVSLTLYSKLGEELLPSVDEGMMYIRFDMPIGTPLEITDHILKDIEQQAFQSMPYVQAMYARSGGGGSHRGFIWLRLPDRSQRQHSLKEIVKTLRKQLVNYPDANVHIVERPSDVSRLLGASRTERLEVDVLGYDLQRARQLAQEIADQVKAIAGVSYANLSLDERRPEMRMRIDRRKASALGISVSSILQTIETGMVGTVASKFRDGRSEHDILVRLQETDRRDTGDLDRLVVNATGGRQVALRGLTDTTLGKGPVGIDRRGQERVITVQAGMDNSRDFDSIATDIERLLATIDIPEGFQVSMGGERQEQRESHRNVLLTIVLAILLVYMVMAALFESLVHPFVILCTIPFAVVGGIVTLWATGTTVSMPVYIGGIMLVGVAVNNGIVMVDYTNQLRQHGRTILAATLEGAVTRLRPVLITTLTTVLALIPMALGIGEGAEVWAPLGLVVVGGLFVSMLFTLFFVPTLYSLIEEHRPESTRGAAAAAHTADAVPIVAD